MKTHLFQGWDESVEKIKIMLDFLILLKQYDFN